MAEKTHAEVVREAADIMDVALTAIVSMLLLMQTSAPDLYHQIHGDLGVNVLDGLTNKGGKIGQMLRKVAGEIEAKEAA